MSQACVLTITIVQRPRHAGWRIWRYLGLFSALGREPKLDQQLRRKMAGVAANVSAFSFRAVAPLFDTNPFRVCGRRDDQRTVKLWAEGPGQVLAVEAVATLV